jgi:hypothetical protein
MKVYVIAALIAILVSLGPALASSQPACPLAPDAKGVATKSTSGLVCVDGALGQWFPLNKARLLLSDVKLGNAALQLTPKLEARIELSEKTSELLRKQLVTEESIANTWKDVAEIQTKRLKQKDAWYKSPILWFAVGAVAAFGISYGVTRLYAGTAR